jgi:probable F420-dependent oxidoreductase
VKFGISYNTGFYGVDPDGMIAVARHAEGCGFESFYVPEHIALYPGAKVGPVEFPPSLPIVDPLETLSFVAAATDRILLGTGVLLLPYHHPVVLAKRLATIDVLSKGRMRLLTVGVGALPGEAKAAGVDFATRGRRADEAIDVLRLLWAGDENGVSFDGEFFSFQSLCSFPKPCGTRTLPVHVGGSRPRPAGTQTRWNTPGGDRSTCPPPTSTPTPATGRPGWWWASPRLTRESNATRSRPSRTDSSLADGYPVRRVSGSSVQPIAAR